MKSAPKPDCSKPRPIRQPLLCKIDSRFFRHQIYIGKNSNSRCEMFKNLGAPARLRPRIIAFSFCKPESTKKLDRIREKATRTTKGMMVVIAPTKTHRVLAPLLYPPRKVAEFPVGALFREK